MNWIKQLFIKKSKTEQCDIHVVGYSLFLLKTKQLGLIKTIKLFLFVRKQKKLDKKTGNTSVGLYSIYDTNTGN
jgi:hypothetical protein